MYTSALQHTSNVSLTPISIMYLLLLAMNYAIVPRLSKRYVHPRTNKRSVALVEEVVKMTMGWGGFVAASMMAPPSIGEDGTPMPSLMEETLSDWTPLSTLIAAGVPSAIYAVQGVVTYVAHQNLDPVSFNGLTQFKVPASALCCYLVLGKGQNGTQMLALGLLMLSTAVFQGSIGTWGEILALKFKVSMQKHKNAGGATTATDDEEVKEKGRNDNKSLNRLLFGVLPCLAATALSGMAGAFSQRSLQAPQLAGSIAHRNAYFYTVEISFCSAVCLLASMGMERYSTRGGNQKDGVGGTTGAPFFEHWTWATLAPVTLRALAGVLTALVHRHLGSVVKGFALVLGLVFSALLQFAMDGRDLTPGQLAGTALVLLSSWMHLTS